MRKLRITQAGALTSAVLAAALTAGCSDSSDASGASDPAASAENLAAAKEAIAPYVGQPTAFPDLPPLSTPVPAGTTVAFMDCGTPTCAVLYDIYQGAADALGVQLDRVSSGSSASTISAAYQSVIQQEPDAVIDAAVDPSLFKDAVDDLNDAGIPIVSTGVVDQDKWGFAGGVFGRPSSELSGELMANWAYVQHGEDTDSVLYFPPDLAFGPVIKDAYVNKMKELCPSCTTREVPIPAAQIGSTAPQTITSDLLSHPDTTVVASASSEMLAGLPAAMKAASIKNVDTLGVAGGPPTLQMVKSGDQTMTVGVDLPTMVWMSMDMVARAVTGEEITAEEAKGIGPMQILTQDDITFDPAAGWAPYPDLADRFKQIWGS